MLISSNLGRLRTAAIWLPLGSLVAVLSTAVLGSTSDNALERAIAEQRERVARSPDAASLSDLGNLLAVTGRTDEARRAYEEALGLMPDSFEAHFNLGVLLLDGRDARDALAHLSQAVAIRPDSAWAHYHLGTALHRLGKRSDAIRAFARAFRLDPDLAFSDVNPSVIGNPLLTEALLMAHDQPLAARTAPRSYADPSAIVELLRPTPETAPETAAGADDRMATEPPPQANAEPATTTETEPPPVLDQSSLEPLPPQSEPRQPAPEETASAPPAEQPPIEPPARRTVGERDLPRSSSTSTAVVAPAAGQADAASRRKIGPDDLQSGGVINQAQPGASPQRGRSRRPTTRFRPGRRSSAQLELELSPRSDPASTSRVTMRAGDL